MVDYREVMRLALDKVSYRVISAQTGAAPATISKAMKAMASQRITSVEQIRGLSDEDLARIVGDRRRSLCRISLLVAGKRGVGTDHSRKRFV